MILIFYLKGICNCVCWGKSKKF